MVVASRVAPGGWLGLAVLLALALGALTPTQAADQIPVLVTLLLLLRLRRTRRDLAGLRLDPSAGAPDPTGQVLELRLLASVLRTEGVFDPAMDGASWRWPSLVEAEAQGTTLYDGSGTPRLVLLVWHSWIPAPRTLERRVSAVGMIPPVGRLWDAHGTLVLETTARTVTLTDRRAGVRLVALRGPAEPAELLATAVGGTVVVEDRAGTLAATAQAMGFEVSRLGGGWWLVGRESCPPTTWPLALCAARCTRPPTPCRRLRGTVAWLRRAPLIREFAPLLAVLGVVAPVSAVVLLGLVLACEVMVDRDLVRQAARLPRDALRLPPATGLRAYWRAGA